MISDIVIEEKYDDGSIEYIATLKYEYSDDVFSFIAYWPIEYDPDYGWKNPSSEDFLVTKTEYKLDSSSVTRQQTRHLHGWYYIDGNGTARSISEAYYVDKAKKEDLYSWNCIYIIPSFEFELQIDEINSQTKAVSGKLVINEVDSISYEFALKNSTLEIPFTTTYDAENGTFVVPAQIEVLNYRLTNPYSPFRYKANRETTFIDVKFKIEYELASENWIIENSISKFNIGDDAEFSLFNKYMVKLANEEKDRIKNSYKQY